jgi:acyl dehydratase
MTAAVCLDFASRPRSLPYMARAVVPTARRADLAPRISARWHRFRVDAADLRSFLRVTGLPAGDGLPLLVPHTFGFRLAMAILTHPTFPVPIWGVLQTRNHIVQLRSIGAGEALDLQTRALPGRVVPKGAEFDLQTTVRAGDEVVWRSKLTFFTRGRFGDPQSPFPLARAPTVEGTLVDEWDLRDADHWQFCKFTGDYNGIHLWDWYAHRLGFGRALYHPPRVLGECMARLSRVDRNGALRFDAWIKGPVPHGSRVRLHEQPVDGGTQFALFAGDERPCIVGRLGVPTDAEVQL